VVDILVRKSAALLGITKRIQRDTISVEINVVKLLIVANMLAAKYAIMASVTIVMQTLECYIERVHVVKLLNFHLLIVVVNRQSVPSIVQSFHPVAILLILILAIGKANVLLAFCS
jgi:hypothetical protein